MQSLVAFFGFFFFFVVRERRFVVLTITRLSLTCGRIKQIFWRAEKIEVTAPSVGDAGRRAGAERCARSEAKKKIVASSICFVIRRVIVLGSRSVPANDRRAVLHLLNSMQGLRETDIDL